MNRPQLLGLACVASALFALTSATAQNTDPAGAQPGTNPAPAAETTALAKPGDDARAAFAELTEMRKGLKGKRGPERMALLERIGSRGEALAATLASDPAGLARVWFEAGEAWRSHGSLERAGAAYDKVLAGPQSRYTGRARFQLAQMQRRLEQWAPALDNYRKAALIEPGSNRAHDARVWIARCLMAQEDPEGGLAAFRAAAKAAATPRQQIDGTNWLIKEFIRRGNLDEAASTLTALDTAIEAQAAKSEPKEADALRKRLSKMSARRALQRAQDKARGAAEDARDVEGDTKTGK